MELCTLEFGRTFIMVSESDSDRCAQAEMIRFKQLRSDISIVSLFNIFFSFISQISSTRLGYCTFTPAIDFLDSLGVFCCAHLFPVESAATSLSPRLLVCGSSPACSCNQLTPNSLCLFILHFTHTDNEGDLLNIFSVKRFRGFCRGKNGRFRIFGNYNTSLCVVST